MMRLHCAVNLTTIFCLKSLLTAEWRRSCRGAEQPPAHLHDIPEIYLIIKGTLETTGQPEDAACTKALMQDALHNAKKPPQKNSRPSARRLIDQQSVLPIKLCLLYSISID